MKTSLALAATLLCACSNSTKSDPPAAAAVSYDNAKSALAATEVQAALDELTARAKTRSDDLAAVQKDVAALKTPSPTAKAVEVTFEPGTAGSSSSTVQGALDDLATRVASLEALVPSMAELKTEVASLKAQAYPQGLACPADTLDMGVYCIDKDPRSPQNWADALICVGTNGRHLCRFEEYVPACFANDALFTQANAMVSDRPNESEVQLIGNKVCANWEKGPLDGKYPYRCCIDKATLPFVAP